LIRILLVGLVVIAAVGLSTNGTGQPQATIGQSVFVKNFNIPGYPPVARQALIQGTVAATLHLRADGSVSEISDLNGPALLVGGVRDSLKSWTFGFMTSPASETKVFFRFRLEGAHDQMITQYRVSGTLPEAIDIVTNPPQTSWPTTQSKPSD